ncbi:MAG: hypothetical protein ACREEM_27555 [Blastocatellia bacterium]
MSDPDVGEKGRRPTDPKEIAARDVLRQFFEQNREQVFYSRQIEVRFEDAYFHWITNRAIRDLEGEGQIRSETRRLSFGGAIKLYWHKGYRFYKRSAANLVGLVEQYSNSQVGEAIGLHGEQMVGMAFAREQFLMKGEATREYGGKIWSGTGHDLDFVFERDGIAYGIEVKNTLPYMDQVEFQVKIRMCQQLGLRPLFVVRMIPRAWFKELIDAGGFALVLKYQLYPRSYQDLAKRLVDELELPVGWPRAIESGTMQRFLRWHEKLL